jgi:hypothetical protein
MATVDNGSMIALGRVHAPNRDGTQGTNAVMWLSPDGISWTGPAPLADSSFPEAVRPTSDGFIAIADAIGRTLDADVGFTAGQVWRVRDGVPALLSELPLGSDGAVSDVFVSDSTVIVTGEDTPNDVALLNAAVWVSVDGGLTFGRVPDQPAFEGINNEVGNLVEIPDGIVGVGSYWETETLHPPPAMWFSPRTESRLVLPGAARARVE